MGAEVVSETNLLLEWTGAELAFREALNKSTNHQLPLDAVCDWTFPGLPHPPLPAPPLRESPSARPPALPESSTARLCRRLEPPVPRETDATPPDRSHTDSTELKYDDPYASELLS